MTAFHIVCHPERSVSEDEGSIHYVVEQGIDLFTNLKLTTLPSGEGGLPRSGKTDEVFSGWFRAFIATEARSEA